MSVFSLQSGRKTLAELFDDQDRMIGAIAKFYNDKHGNKTVSVYVSTRFLGKMLAHLELTAAAILCLSICLQLNTTTQHYTHVV